MKHLSLFAAALILLSAPMSAQRPDPEHRAAMIELRTQLRTWFEQKVAPTVREWQRSYDATLSAEDLATVKKLRAEAAAMRAERHQAMMNGEGKPGKKQRKEMKGMMKEMGAELRPIMERSRETLTKIFETNEEKIEQWRDEAEAMIEAWEDKYDDLDMRGGRHMGMEHMGMFAGRGGRPAVRFVLWDGTIPQPPAQGVLTPNAPVRVVPAPSGTAATISTEQVPDGKAAVEVYDMNGRLLQTVQTAATAGKVEQVIDTSGLEPGTYMVSIRTATGRRTSQLVVTR